MNQADLTQLIAVFFYFVTFLLHYYFTRLPQNEQSVVNELAHTVVTALEQQAGLLNGAAKKQESVRIINKILVARKISVPPELVDACIEAAVYGVNQGIPTANTTKIPTLPK